MTCKDCIHSGLCYKENEYDNFPYRCGNFISDKVLEERPQSNIRWTDKIFMKSNGDIIDFEGRVVGHVNLEEIKGDADMRQRK